VGFSVPTEVSVSGSDHRLWGNIRMSVTVRCQCTVLYELSQVQREGDFLVLPEPQVTVAYIDPPGQRGTFEYSCDALRSDSLLWDKPAVEALKLRLLDQAPREAHDQYLQQQHGRYEQEFANDLRGRLEQRAQAHAAIADRPWPFLWEHRGSLVATVALLVMSLVLWLAVRMAKGGAS
jgi:hypothetical protein